MAAVPDADALALFQQQWAVYRKFIDHDYGSNAGAYRTLRRIVTEAFPRPFAFLDLACGDATGAVIALKARRSRIITASICAARARDGREEPGSARLRDRAGAWRLHHGDHETAGAADVVWIGLSLHHLAHAGKLKLMRAIREMIGPRGLFLRMSRPASRRDRAASLDRYEAIARQG